LSLILGILTNVLYLLECFSFTILNEPFTIELKGAWRLMPQAGYWRWRGGKNPYQKPGMRKNF
jgi:hypothetical protein